MSIQRKLTVGVAALVLASAVGAQQPGADTKELDQRVYKVLRDVINAGAQLYNRPTSDHNGCYRLYQGSVMTLRPLLDHRPALQKAIDDALAAAEREPSVTERAFIMRAVIDRIRDETGGKTTTAKKDTLWERLGGEKNVRKVVDDFMELEHSDPKVDFFRGGKRKLTEEQLTDLKQKIVEFVSQAAGGPLKYTGKDMKEAHKGMEITEDQFNALVADLKEALDKNGAKPADRDALLEAVRGLRKDVVEKKDGDKPKPKKDEGKEPIKKDDDKPKPKKDEGGKKEGAAESVKGKLTLDGKPLGGARITFVPAEGDAENSPFSQTNDDGSYEIKAGLPKGAYKVQVTAPDAKVPAAYGKANTTPLSVSVSGRGHIFDIVLKTEKEE